MDDNELDKLKVKLLKIRRTIQNANSEQLFDEVLQPWIRALNSAAYQAHDLLENYESQRQVCIDRIKKIHGKLDKIDQEIDHLHSTDTKHLMIKRPETSSVLDECSVHGRKEEKKKIIDLLLSSDQKSHTDNVSIISAVGMPGIGKTTLAQIIYNDEKVCRWFQIRAWVSVDRGFSLKKQIKSIIQSIESTRSSPNERPAVRSSVNINRDLDVLLYELKQLMSEKKFFIVLDGILEINEDDWNPLKAALRDGVRGSKILITTQNQYVAKITGSIYTLSLDCLSNDDCRSLFEEKAFPCGRSCGNLEEILEKVDTKCRGVPLVARTLGHFLNSKTYRHDWDAILESDLWSILGVNNESLELCHQAILNSLHV